MGILASRKLDSHAGGVLTGSYLRRVQRRTAKTRALNDSEDCSPSYRGSKFTGEAQSIHFDQRLSENSHGSARVSQKETPGKRISSGESSRRAAALRRYEFLVRRILPSATAFCPRVVS